MSNRFDFSTGDRVKHRNRPEIGTIDSRISNGLVLVKYDNAEFCVVQDCDLLWRVSPFEELVALSKDMEDTDV